MTLPGEVMIQFPSPSHPGCLFSLTLPSTFTAPWLNATSTSSRSEKCGSSSPGVSSFMSVR